jgi:hypothetical protein
MSKVPDMVVMNENGNYNSSLRSYPTDLASPSFNLIDVNLVKTESAKKMIDVFNQERQELIDKIEKLSKEYLDSILVWESKMSFDPIVGHTYYMYNFKGVNTLSLLSPTEWNQKDSFIGAYKLTADRKWIQMII